MRDPRPSKAERIQPNYFEWERSPTGRANEQAPMNSGSPMNRRRQSKSLRTLIVDDFQDAAQSLAELMRVWGHSAITVRSGQEALQSWHDCDVILLELALPDMDGCELVRRVRDDSTRICPFFIAVTTEGQDEYVRRGGEAGIHLHLVKPIDPAVLCGVLERFSDLIASIPPK